MNQQTRHPLLGMFDIDPGRWRPMYYGVEISVPVTEGAIGKGSITINQQPFIMTRITHKIVGDTANPTTSGLYQDGQYNIEFRDEQSNYQKGSIPADLMFGSFGAGAGSSFGGFLMDLPFPLPFQGNRTLSFDVQNRVDRTLTPQSDTFLVSICVAGIADWGVLKQQGSR